jgi:hypothetical protein
MVTQLFLSSRKHEYVSSKTKGACKIEKTSHLIFVMQLLVETLLCRTLYFQIMNSKMTHSPQVSRPRCNVVLLTPVFSCKEKYILK